MNRFTRSMLALAVVGGISIPAISIVRAATPDRPAAVRLDDKEHQHPHLGAALMALRDARKELEMSDKVFGHHRQEAIEQTEKAIVLTEEAWHAGGHKDIELAPIATKLDEPALHGHMHKALSDLHDAYKELDDVEEIFERSKRAEAIDHVEKAIHTVRDGINEVEK